MEDEKKGLESLMEAARGGDPEAQAALGTLYAAGRGMEQDFEQALVWLRAAAEQGSADAMFNLGIMAENGLGMDPDHEQAALWFWQAAEKGDTGARMRLGAMLIKGHGFNEGAPVIQAVRAAADGGHPYAQSFLGKLFLEGSGVEQSDTLAERWFRKAAQQGDKSAAYNLAEMMVEGRTRETSQEEAAGWFFSLGRSLIEKGDLVRAFDCLVSIKRIDPGNFLAQRLEQELEQANREKTGGG